MANIRFVKSPNDNRIRSLPSVDVKTTPVPKENFFITTAVPKISNVINITNSTQQSFSETTDMLIASRNKNNNYQTEMPSSFVHEETIYNSNNKCDNSLGQTNVTFDSTKPYKYLSSNNVFATNQIVQEKAMNSNVSPEVSAYNNENTNVSSTAERNNNNNVAFGKRTESCCSINNGNATETVASIQDPAHEYRKNSSLRLTESQKEKDESKFQLMSFDSDHNDDPEEEEDKFPELNSLFGNMESKVCQEKEPMLIQETEHHSKGVQEKQLMASSASPSLSTASLGRQRQQLSYLFQSGARNRHIRSYRPMNRTVSDAALIENNRLSSFFKSITDEKYYGLDEEDYDDDDDTDINFIETSDYIKKNELHRLTQPLKVAWVASTKNHQGENIFDKTKETTTQPDPSKSPATKPSEGHIAFSRSLSGDSMITDRLRIRRCALADPESMIMRQDVREKIEREVERRRSSMVRKISQFFNVHLGLNKEEDLI